MGKNLKNKTKEEKKKGNVKQEKQTSTFPRAFVGMIADEVAKTLVQRLPTVMTLGRGKKSSKKRGTDLHGGFFLDTSAIIDGRIFEVIQLGLLSSVFIIPESILTELKHIADSQDIVKRERGRRGLEYLEKLKKEKGIKVFIVSDNEFLKKDFSVEVDEKLIVAAKFYKGKIITCDYNLSKKASIQGIITININTLANLLKVTAVPGEALQIKLLHIGKDKTQGVGYLDDGTMIVAEEASLDVGKEIDVVVVRVIQTTAGRILFAKKI